MIHIKLLSGDILAIERLTPITIYELRSFMEHPYPVFFRGESKLHLMEVVNPDDTLSVVFQSYRCYFVWCGSENSVWPGERDKTFCYDFSLREQVEWDPKMITDNDVLVVDYLSFGLYQQYNKDIKYILNIDFLPVDLDFQAIKNCFGWKERALYDNRELEFLDFIGDYGDVVSWTKYMGIFRVIDSKPRTPLEWISRISG